MEGETLRRAKQPVAFLQKNELRQRGGEEVEDLTSSETWNFVLWLFSSTSFLASDEEI